VQSIKYEEKRRDFLSETDNFNFGVPEVSIRIVHFIDTYSKYLRHPPKIRIQQFYLYLASIFELVNIKFGGLDKLWL